MAIKITIESVDDKDFLLSGRYVLIRSGLLLILTSAIVFSVFFSELLDDFYQRALLLIFLFPVSEIIRMLYLRARVRANKGSVQNAEASKNSADTGIRKKDRSNSWRVAFTRDKKDDKN